MNSKWLGLRCHGLLFVIVIHLDPSVYPQKDPSEMVGEDDLLTLSTGALSTWTNGGLSEGLKPPCLTVSRVCLLSWDLRQQRWDDTGRYKPQDTRRTLKPVWY